MDASRFDRWTASLSRRTVAGVLGLGALGLPSLIEAKKKHKHKKKRKKRKKDKRKRKEHNGNTCTAGQHTDSCGGTTVSCLSSAGEEGICETTTSNAGYCAVSGMCTDCTEDVDCQGGELGPDAACIVCPDCMGFDTACVGPSGSPI